jgi:hypothetical protein
MVSFLSFAGKFVLIPIDLVTLFNNNDLKIHYYFDDYVLAATDNLTYTGAVILDDYAFENDKSYAIVYCFDQYKEDYSAKVLNNSL